MEIMYSTWKNAGRYLYAVAIYILGSFSRAEK